MSAIDLFVVAVVGYAGLGAVFALAFVLRGAWAIDEAARASWHPTARTNGVVISVSTLLSLRSGLVRARSM